MRNEEIREITGLNALLQKMNCSSIPGKKHVADIKFYKTKENIKKELDALDSCLEYFRNDELVNKIKKLLYSLRNISYTLKKLEHSDCILDDIQLFELKEFALLSEESRQVMYNCPKFLELKKLDDVVKLLDPENTKLRHFYIYDTYDKELEKLRSEKKKLLKIRNDPEKLRKIETREEEIEENVRKRLSKSLFEKSNRLKDNFERLIKLDIYIAKIELIKKYKLNKPSIAEDEISYKGLFNPLLKESLERIKKKFQPVSVSIDNGSTIITGANMTGKSVLLRTLALSQQLFQMGFYVPAENAKIVPVDTIHLISGDYQSMLRGLSSFAAEMIELDRAVKDTESGLRGLLLFDEPARNTNPYEGHVIVKACILFYANKKTFAVAATHYDLKVANSKIKQYRVKGLIEDSLTQEEIHPENIIDYVDYSLQRVSPEETVPKEALRVLKLLKLDNPLFDKAKNILLEDRRNHEDE
ncbi:MAG: DNA mismatch repair protein MutS [Thermotogota bacterium]|nr:DNA mismatch repair protein MutS [Thermotogota bacterium]